jgi:hypothetical protein
MAPYVVQPGRYTTFASATIARAEEGEKRCRRKFLRYFPHAFRDQNYLAWERDYKWEAHQEWDQVLDQKGFESLLQKGEYEKIALHAVRVESRRPLLFSFEKMALRDAVRDPAGAKAFAQGLFSFLHGPGAPETRFEKWCADVCALPRRQTRVLTWPLVTVFGFLAQPAQHFFVKPNVTRRAATQYGFPLFYQSRPNWRTYSQLLEWARKVKRDLSDLRPRDLIDIQSFLWVQGSDEYK